MKERPFDLGLPEFRDGDRVVAVFKYGHPQFLEDSVPHAEISCPMCNGQNGYRIWDHETGVWWACSEDACIRKNKPPKRKIVYPGWVYEKGVNGNE